MTAGSRRLLAFVRACLLGGAAAVVAGLAAAWAVLTVLAARADIVGALSGHLAGTPQGIVTAFGAATGASPTVAVAGVAVPLPVDAAHRGAVLLVLLAPLTAAATIGWCAARVAVRQRFPVRLTVPATALAFAVLAAAAVATVGRPGASLVTYHVDAWPVLAFALAWATVLGGAVAGWRAAVLRQRGTVEPARLRTRRRARRALTVTALVASSLLVAAPTQAASPTPGRSGASTFRRPGVMAALERLHAASPTTWRVAFDADRGVPSTVQLDVPLGLDVTSWLRTNSRLFGFRDVTSVLRQTLDGRDDLGRRHVWFQQVVDGIPVEYADLGVHLDPSGRYVKMVSNGLRPDLVPDRTRAARGLDSARALAGKDMPNGTAVRDTRLLQHPLDQARAGVDVGSVPVWSVWLQDGDRGVSTEYLVAATGPERIVKVRNKAMPVLSRWVFDLKHNENGAASGQLVRQERGAPSSIADANDAYDRSGDVYQYFHDVLGRDSFDGHGADMNIKVRWRKNEVNAYWNQGGPNGYTAFGDGMLKLDVVAHEWTHALTQAVFEHNANGDLYYEFESGALNESISDSFAEAVEARFHGQNDWLVGGELKDGPLRSMADPKKYKQPAHMRDYKEMCYMEDAGGVHTNSGIPNHAFYLIAYNYTVGIAANLLWYTIAGGDFGMLASDTSFADFRIQQIAAAETLYGRESDLAHWVAEVWSSVGVEDDTVVNHPDECSCAVNTSLGISSDGLGGGPLAQGLYLDLHRLLAVADTDASASLTHYARAFLAGSDRMSELMRANGGLKQQFAAVLYAMQPVVQQLANDASPPAVITAAKVAQVDALLDALAAADRAAGGHELADLIDVERARVDLDALVGLDGVQAREFLDTFYAA